MRRVFADDRHPLSCRPPLGKTPDKGEDQRSQIWRAALVGEPTRETDEPLGVIDFRVAGGARVATRVRPGCRTQQREHARELAEKGRRHPLHRDAGALLGRVDRGDARAAHVARRLADAI
ncbi:MAG: hypothetical protein R3B99_06300 [Polyangiales bacterium]